MFAFTPLTPLILFFAQQVDPAELQKAIQQDAAATPAPPPLGEATPTVTGLPPNNAQESARRPGSSLLNPALSVILDGAFGYYGKSPTDFAALRLPVAGDDPAAAAPGLDAREGFSIQEVELAASAAIDPYLEGAVFLTIPNLEGLEVEEGYLVTTALPANLQFKAGTFRSQIGRNNTQHLHLQNFTRRPLMTSLIFGADGLRGPGVQASVLLPVSWFATFYAEALGVDMPDESVAGANMQPATGIYRATPGRLTYTAELEQYWDLSENTSLLFGLNFATGKTFGCAADPCTPATIPSSRSLLYGGDLYFKWKPANVAQSYASVQWTTEFFVRELDGSYGHHDGAGYTEPVVQIARRWYLGARFDVTGLPADRLPRRYGYAGSLTFAPSEFSRFRLYAQELTGPGVPSSTVGFLQAEFSMGAHGAHPF